MDANLMEIGTRDGRVVRVAAQAGATSGLLVLRGAVEAEVPFEAGGVEGAELRTLALAAICRAIPHLDPARVTAPGEPVGQIERLLDATRAVAADLTDALRRLRDGALDVMLARLGWALVVQAQPETTAEVRRWISPDGACRALTVPGWYGDAPARTWEALAAVAPTMRTDPANLLAALLAEGAAEGPTPVARFAPCAYEAPDPATCCGKGCDHCTFTAQTGWRCVDCGEVGHVPLSVRHSRCAPQSWVR